MKFEIIESFICLLGRVLGVFGLDSILWFFQSRHILEFKPIEHFDESIQTI
jgi:hypothetical protein